MGQDNAYQEIQYLWIAVDSKYWALHNQRACSYHGESIFIHPTTPYVTELTI
jgi:hypothetical protein